LRRNRLRSQQVECLAAYRYGVGDENSTRRNAQRCSPGSTTLGRPRSAKSALSQDSSGAAEHFGREGEPIEQHRA
jgi:hypothetical protein